MLGLSKEEVEKCLISCKKAININDLMRLFARTNKTKFRNKYIKSLIAKGLVEMTIPDKPRSSKQKYIITKKGKQLLTDKPSK